MGQANHRISASSKRGRQLTSGGGKLHDPSSISQEIREHNAAVERKRDEKAIAKYRSRNSGQAPWETAK